MVSRNDEAEAIECVVSFTAAMNDWETRQYFRMRIEHGREPKNKNDEKRAGSLSLSQLAQEYWKTMALHCTERKRAYAGPEMCSNPPKYDGVGMKTIIEVTRPKPRRIEIICGIGEFPNEQYKFVLFKKVNGWLIDNAFSRIDDNNKWGRSHL